MTFLGYGLAVLIGVSLGLLGGGGAILTVPVLVYVMGVGVKQAVPTSLVIVGLTSSVTVRLADEDPPERYSLTVPLTKTESPAATVGAELV